MKSVKSFGRTAFAAVLSLCLVFWTVVPVTGHAPTVLETLQDHMEMLEHHGHSHGFEEDLFWALHGHTHDASDHDHNQALLFPDDRQRQMSADGDTWRLRASPGGPHRTFRIERPPRA